MTRRTTMTTDPLASAAKLAKQIRNPEDTNVETPSKGLEIMSHVGKDGYKNPPDEDLNPLVRPGGLCNPADAVARANDALMVHRDHAISVYTGVYKQARLMGLSEDEARQSAEDAKISVDKSYRQNLLREIAVEKAKLSRMRVAK
jgi:hypothetical protein